MYSKHKLADVRLGIDKGSLRLQFSTRISQEFYGKRQAYKGLGRSDTPENQQWAEGIIRRIQADINHPDGGLFDPTLAKYLDVKPMLATVTQLPTAKPLPRLGELWENYKQWKLDTKQIKESTHINIYQYGFDRLLKDFLDLPLTQENAQKIIDFLFDKESNKGLVKKMLRSLSHMSERAVKEGLIAKNYFLDVAIYYKIHQKSNQQQEEEDRRAYTIEARDEIIKSFYSSCYPSVKHIAPLIEFLFLTGCRHGEAFGLTWKHIKFDTGWIIINQSYSTVTKKVTKSTKTGNTRIFRMKGLDRLINLLTNLKEEQKPSDDEEYIFLKKNGSFYTANNIADYWHQRQMGRDKYKKNQDGIVLALAKAGTIPQYLKPYSTRHTFISIQANNGTDLGILADSVGNSVEILIKHYLQVDKERTLKDI